MNLDDRVLRLEQNWAMWHPILKPQQRRPMCVPLRAAVKAWAEGRRV
jgi:hypothetical protein